MTDTKPLVSWCCKTCGECGESEQVHRDAERHAIFDHGRELVEIDVAVVEGAEA